MGKTFGKVVFAAITGAVAGLLLSPKSGKENREDIKKKSEDIKKKVQQKADEAKETGKKVKKSWIILSIKHLARLMVLKKLLVHTLKKQVQS